jgi:hypothetical protein
MDLVGVLKSAHSVLEYMSGGPGAHQPWANDEREFEIHFGAPYELFATIVDHLSNDQKKLLEATLDVNPEAAVLWILAMDVVDE